MGIVSVASQDVICVNGVWKSRSGIRQHVNHKTRELAVKKGFVRRKDVCGTCGEEREVILVG